MGAARGTGGGSQEVVAALRAIPPDEYANKDEVARPVRMDPASDLDLSPAQHAEQARKGGRPGSPGICGTHPCRRSRRNSTADTNGSTDQGPSAGGPGTDVRRG
ncbi:DUF2795 domain-containing protein [Streptomyces nigra]|uniref:DUF2795 domain-containing protein n=1 Tax=Streptomyces nigra TaxID=1827580 RepID=UPI001FCA4192|nr:DUF2795 domain-containing protein [Streptomyces nigra]